MGIRSDHVPHSAAVRFAIAHPPINFCERAVFESTIEDAQVTLTGGGAVDPVDSGADIEDILEKDSAYRRVMEAAYNAQLPPGVSAGRGQGSEKPRDVLLLSRDARAVLKRRASGRDPGVCC